MPRRSGLGCPSAAQKPSAQRELALRRQCYPAWVQRGKLDAGDATYQLKVMEEIVCSLMALEAMVRTLMRVEAEERQLSLCNTKPSAVPHERCAGIPDGLCRRESSNMERSPQVCHHLGAST